MPAIPAYLIAPDGAPPAYDDLAHAELPPPHDGSAALPSYSAQEPPSALTSDILTLAVAAEYGARTPSTPAAQTVRPWRPQSRAMQALRLPDELVGQPRPAFHPRFEPIAGAALEHASLLSLATLFAHSCGTTLSATQRTLPLEQTLRGVATREMLSRWRQLGAGAHLSPDASAQAEATVWQQMAARPGTSEPAEEASAVEARLQWAQTQIVPMLPQEERLNFLSQLRVARDMHLELRNSTPDRSLIDGFIRPGAHDPEQGLAFYAALDQAFEIFRQVGHSDVGPQPSDRMAMSAALGISVALSGLRAWIVLQQTHGF